MAFSPDGGTLASAGRDRIVKLWHTVTGGEIRTLRGHSDWVFGVSFSPDGRILASASADHTVKLWASTTDQEVQSLRGHDAAILSVAWRFDGRTLASGSNDRTIKLWDLGTGQELLTLRGHVDSVSDLTFSPNGKAARVRRPGQCHQAVGPGNGHGAADPARALSRGRLRFVQPGWPDAHLRQS